MTETEANTKTCHKTLAGIASADGSAPWFQAAACIASACMAWRWATAINKQGDREPSNVTGYCGLAGKP